MAGRPAAQAHEPESIFVHRQPLMRAHRLRQEDPPTPEEAHRPSIRQKAPREANPASRQEVAPPPPRVDGVAEAGRKRSLLRLDQSKVPAYAVVSVSRPRFSLGRANGSLPAKRVWQAL